jgi:2'-5' RNA ligase
MSFSPSGGSKTPCSAVAVLPPVEVWPPIQAIRQRYDRCFHRWMPHINLLYPFYPAEYFAAVLPRLTTVCRQLHPFEIVLRDFRFFVHPSGRATLWLAPEPAEPLRALQAALQAACPECDDVARFPQGFTPHLSVGQAKSLAEARQRVAHFQAGWQPLSFRVTHIALLQRQAASPFQVAAQVPLGESTPLD